MLRRGGSTKREAATPLGVKKGTTKSFVDVKVIDDVAFIRIGDPRDRNALPRHGYHQLGRALDSLAARSGVRFVVLRGNGGIFSSGGDLNELSRGLPQEYLWDYWQRMNATVQRLRSMPQIVVAAVEGLAVGAGAALALSADVVIAERDVRFRFNFVRLGLLPDAGTTILVQALVGLARAREILFSGRWIEAEEAHDFGMVARLSEPGALDSAVEELLGELREAPADTLALLKNLMDASGLAGHAQTVRLEGVYQLAAAFSGEYVNRVSGILAGLGQSKPVANGDP
jgi:enoyl-CoA hydratase/carnithine racemase